MKQSLIWLFFFIAIFCIVWFGSSQMRNIRAAQAHATIVTQALSRYPAFNKVRATFGTAHGGVLVVIGDVSGDEDMIRLKQIVKATNPPVKVDYSIRFLKPQKSGIP